MNIKKAAINLGLPMALCAVLLGLNAPANAADPSDTVSNIAPPADFTSFDLEGAPDDGKLLSHYLWYHFTNRLNNGLCLFNREYLTIADMWLDKATDKATGLSIQDCHRRDLNQILIDPEGYVATHQHFSHAHDLGWPFPLWTQAGSNPDLVRGKAAGWHFQDNGIPMWLGETLRAWQRPEYMGSTAAAGWTLENAQSHGIVEEAWQIEAAGPSPTITSPAGMSLSATDSPYIQIRWKRTGDAQPANPPYLEWLCNSDDNFSADRRMYFYPERTPLSVKYFHSILPLHKHPLWQGKIKQFRIALAPGESDVTVDIDSIFCAYDTRHSINNPILILSAANYFRWSRDLGFLRENINRMRTALKYQQTVMGGMEFNHIRNPWPGHDGVPGWVKQPDGEKALQSGHGIGNNYWDIMPFGWDDCYATNQYYAATLAMAEIEQAVRDNPGWDIPLGAMAMNPDTLGEHAAKVKDTANTKFWNPETGRFVACIDKNGRAWDYGMTFLNLDAIWYGLATEEHAKSIMAWIDGQRTVEGDTSTGADIYHWRLAPRATTLRNLEWYGQGWISPESILWGGQVQDGGAVLGFSFHDLWARIQVLGPDNAFKRLQEILAWQRDVDAAGGYRAYYAAGKPGTTLQGGGTAGGIGIDAEFYESSLIPAIIPYGFLGVQPNSARLQITPKLPATCPKMSLRNLLYAGVQLDITAETGSPSTCTITVKNTPAQSFRLAVSNATLIGNNARPDGQDGYWIETSGVYLFRNTGSATP